MVASLYHGRVTHRLEQFSDGTVKLYFSSLVVDQANRIMHKPYPDVVLTVVDNAPSSNAAGERSKSDEIQPIERQFVTGRWDVME